MGIVAAQWSDLESLIHFAISQFAGLDRETSLILTAPSSLNGWVDMMLNLTRDSPECKKLYPELLKLCNDIKVLHLERNKILHSTWIPEFDSSGHKPRWVLRQNASGVGIPKKGKKTEIDVKYTAKQMRDVAWSIEQCRRRLVDIIPWWS